MTIRPTSESLAAGPSLDDALAANRAFYHAFSSRDLATMDTIWARGVPVLCIHPGWPPLMERAAVLSSWRDIMKNPASPNAYSRNDRAFIYGKTAIVVCEEVLDGGVLAATNIFIEELGSWRLIHHQASPIADPDAGSRSPASPASASLSSLRSGQSRGVPGRSPAGIDQPAVAEQGVDLRPLRVAELEVEDLEIALQVLLAAGLGDGDDVRLVEQPAQCDLNRRLAMRLSDPDSVGCVAASPRAMGL